MIIPISIIHQSQPMRSITSINIYSVIRRSNDYISKKRLVHTETGDNGGSQGAYQYQLLIFDHVPLVLERKSQLRKCPASTYLLIPKISHCDPPTHPLINNKFRLINQPQVQQ